MKLKISLVFLFFILLLSVNVFAQDSSVLVVEIKDTIDQSTVEIFKEV